MSRSSSTCEQVFDQKVERITRENRKAKMREENLPTLTLSTSNFKSKREVEVSEKMVEHRTLSNSQREPAPIMH
jgi:hypothetical protein